jgi:hypothetical protein
LTVTAVTTPGNGAAVINPDGTITYTPDPNFCGTDAFDYTISDGSLTDTATVTITVNCVNDAPDAVNDAAVTDEDVAVGITVLANDSDVDGDPLTVTAVTTPGNGAAVINPDGTITYTPDPDFCGTDAFDYTISDGSLTDTATVTITVNCVNDPPDAVNDAVVTDEDVAVGITVLANDSDPDGDPLTVTAVTTPGNGAAVINPDGTITYTPDLDFCGTDAFDYTISDGSLTDAATVTITVNCVNDAPDAVNDAAVTDEDVAVGITVLANDSDVDGDPLTVTAVTTPGNGTAVINPDGTITYTPDLDFCGTDAFDYTISDGSLTDTATVNITINCVDDPTENEDPVIVSITNNAAECGEVSENGEVVLTSLFTDANDSDTHTATIDWGDGTTTNGTVTESSGTVSGVHSYALGGIYTITLTVSDGTAGDVATTFALITGAGVHNGELQIIGTDEADHVTVNRQGNGLFKVHADFFEGKSFRTFSTAGVNRIVMLLCDGDDHATIDGKIDTPSLIDGGEGDDHLNGGEGPNVILGAEGTDMLIGGSRRDLLIGGTGADRIVGNKGDDVLIGGSTPFDVVDDNFSPGVVDGLFDLLDVWNGPGSYAQRVADLQSFLSPGGTVFDDGDTDVMTGSANRDLFFQGLGDVLTDRHKKKNAEIVL